MQQIIAQINQLHLSCLPSSFPISTALATFVPLIFCFVHGARRYRHRELLVFAAITLGVSNLLENLSVLTGFPTDPAGVVWRVQNIYPVEILPAPVPP